MLVKEYRILLPLSVDEYKVAQLYMIQKKSSVESTGADSGVEIITNEPYSDGPGGSGQYTYKVYHVGSHLPSWFRAILPKSALRVEEEAWNAYPYTKTRYTCPFVEKFMLEVETRYFNDAGTQKNVFGLSDAELRDRIVDVIDIVKDTLPANEYCKEEDPKIFQSTKTGRGPLTDDWVDVCLKSNGKLPIMCAYKVCRVEFRYWGMQTKIEKFIHDIALRKTMVRAHRQAWAWQDEWWGLTIDDIRVLERKAQELLSAKMAAALGENRLNGQTGHDFHDSKTITSDLSSQNDDSSATLKQTSTSDSINRAGSRANYLTASGSQKSLRTPTSSIDLSRPTVICDHLSAIKSDSFSDDEDEEFFDAADELYNCDYDEQYLEKARSNLVRWSSIDLAPEDESTGIADIEIWP